MLASDFALTTGFGAVVFVEAGVVAKDARDFIPGTDVSIFILTGAGGTTSTATFGILPPLAGAAGVLPVGTVFADLFTLLATAPLAATTAVADFVFVFDAVAFLRADSGFVLAGGALAVAAATLVLLLGMEGVLVALLPALDLLLATLAELVAAAADLAAAGGFDETFAEEVEAFAAVLVETLAGAVDLWADPCDERVEDVFVAEEPDFASFFEDAILIAPSRPAVETSRCSITNGAQRAEYS